MKQINHSLGTLHSVGMTDAKSINICQIDMLKIPIRWYFSHTNPDHLLCTF